MANSVAKRSRTARRMGSTTTALEDLLMMSHTQLELLLQTDMEKAQGDKIKDLVKKLTSSKKQVQCETSELTNKIVLVVTASNEKECSCENAVGKCHEACECSIKCLVGTLSATCQKAQASRVANTLKSVEKKLLQAKPKASAKTKAKRKSVMKSVQKVSTKYTRYLLLRNLVLELLHEHVRDWRFRKQYAHLIGTVLRQKNAINSQYKKLKSEKLINVLLRLLKSHTL